MFNWAKSTLASVAGTQEPIYGPSAIQSVTEQAKETPYTELKREDLKWNALQYTNVETQTFYMTSDSGHIGLAQVIYSNVAGIRTTVQFNSKIIYPDGTTPHLWCSTPLEGYGFDPDKYSFYANNVSIDFAEDGNSYSIKSAVSNDCLVNLKFTKTAPGFVVGKNGTSNFGTDPKAPWGTMKHAFWPRCKVEGSMITKGGEVKFDGRGLYIHALQGMKPHHAAAQWNFVNFQSPDYSAIMMEFTTPPSYGSTVVNVGCIAKENEIVFAGATNTAERTKIAKDAENEWPEPTAVKWTWTGKTKDGKEATGEIVGELGPRIDRVDVMAEVPGFVKTIVASAVGTKPYIYQYAPKLKLKVNVGGEEVEQEGQVFSEATFIS